MKQKFEVDTFDKSIEYGNEKTVRFLKNIKKSFVLLAGELDLPEELEQIYKEKIIKENVHGKIITHRLMSPVMRELAKKYKNLEIFHLPYREGTHFLVGDGENIWIENHPAGTIGTGEIYYGASKIGKQYKNCFDELKRKTSPVMPDEIDSVFPINPVPKITETEITRKFEEEYFDISALL